MSWRGKWEPKGATTALVAAVPQNIDLTTGVQNRRLLVKVTATATVANQDGAARVRNRGSVLALLNQFAVSEGGNDTWKQVDPRMLGFLTGLLSAAPRTQVGTTRLTDGMLAVNGAYALSESCIVNFGNPLGISDRETFYLEANASQRFQFRTQLNAAPETRIFTATAGTTTVAISNVVVTVYQDYSITEPGLPYFKPLWTTQIQDVAAAATQLRTLILTQHRLRGIVIQQDTTGIGEVNNIINSLILRGDNQDIIGPNAIPFADHRMFLESKYGGLDTVVGVQPGGLVTTFPIDSSGAYTFIDFCPDGRISSYAYPNAQFTNLQFQFDCQPSVSVGAASSQIRIVLLEMSRPQPVAGKLMVTDTLPAFAEVG